MRVATSLYLQFRHPSCRRASLAALALSACLCAAVEARAPRVSLVLKADIRPGVTDGLTSKVETVERHLAP